MSKPSLTERDIQETCSEFLVLDGWRRVRTDLPRLRGMGVQEKGMADDLYIRYAGPSRKPEPHDTRVNALHLSASDVLWIEWKRRTGKVAARQHAWHAAERTRGALTLIAGIDFTADISGFYAWYFASGLNRRMKA